MSGESEQKETRETHLSIRKREFSNWHPLQTNWLPFDSRTQESHCRCPATFPRGNAGIAAFRWCAATFSLHPLCIARLPSGKKTGGNRCTSRRRVKRRRQNRVNPRQKQHHNDGKTDASGEARSLTTLFWLFDLFCDMYGFRYNRLYSSVVWWSSSPALIRPF